MSVAAPPQATGIATSIARRAVDLARDPGVSLEDGAHHLRRLAMERDPVLMLALHELPRSECSAQIECARLLVRLAMQLAPSS